MFRMIMRTKNEFSTFVLRLGLGAAFWPHGAQKALGMYDGRGIEGTVEMFDKAWGIPEWQVYGVIAAEFLGSIALMLGFMSRIAALGIIAVMAGAIHFVHLKNGFFNSNGGYEYPLLWGLIALACAFRGGEALSVDRAIGREI